MKVHNTHHHGRVKARERYADGGEIRDPDLTRSPGYMGETTRTYPENQRSALETLDRMSAVQKRDRGEDLTPNERTRQGFRAVRKNQTKGIFGNRIDQE